MRRVSAAEANRSFSKLLRDAAQGEHIVVTSHGRPIARLGPYDDPQASREEARAALMRRLRSQPVGGELAWSRDELYED